MKGKGLAKDSNLGLPSSPNNLSVYIKAEGKLNSRKAWCLEVAGRKTYDQVKTDIINRYHEKRKTHQNPSFKKDFRVF